MFNLSTESTTQLPLIYFCSEIIIRCGDGKTAGGSIVQRIDLLVTQNIDSSPIGQVNQMNQRRLRLERTDIVEEPCLPRIFIMY
jgi:hypothetical protein